MTKNVIIAGNPGAGKTTLVKSIAAKHSGVFGGFYTEEIRGADGGRRGFIVKTFDGKERVFASKNQSDLVGNRIIKLKKYRVDLDALEETAIPAAELSVRAGRITVVDEIGAMEILSELFRLKISEWLTSSAQVLATIRLKSRHFTDGITNRPDCLTLHLTRENAAKIKNEAERTLGLL
ncbi:MAG: nucleoside-triphosphatase [Endomicrobiia bacterium]|nr:nucleoside-triphosphatase [Endomicrobiia bacterium]